MERRGADTTDRGGMVLMTRMVIEEGKSIDRGETGERMMAGVRSIAHGGQAMRTREAINIAHERRRTKKVVGVITTGPSAMMLPPTKTTTAGEETIDRDEIVRKRNRTVHDATIQDRTAVVTVTTEIAIDS
jgi:hypothetical protein